MTPGPAARLLQPAAAMESDVPEMLPDMQKRLVDFAASGLRRILRYE